MSYCSRRPCILKMHLQRSRALLHECILHHKHKLSAHMPRVLLHGEFGLGCVLDSPSPVQTPQLGTPL
jgi:hypothetical protein